MSSDIKYTKAQRLALAIKREREMLAERAVMTDEEIAELTGADVDQDVRTATRLYTWSDFAAAYRAGDVCNGHRRIIESNGSAR